MQALIRAWSAHLDHEGSTRAVGLMRVLFAALCWARWADELMPLRNDHWAYWALAAVFYTSTTAMFFGVRARLATAMTAATLWTMWAGFGWLGDHEPWRHHHTYTLTIAVVWLALTPCDRSFSFDRWLAVRRAEATGASPPAERGPLWAVPLLGAQCSAVYFFSALDKTNVRFLSGDQLEAVFMHFYSGSDPIDLPGFALFCMLSAWFVVAFEYFLPFALFVRRWHGWLVPAAMLFHGILYVSIPVGTFTATMWVYYLAYLDPEAVHRVVGQLTRE
ncbi:MAG: HTTM domain-containing protein [Alphaproteobacteria bacterium]|nr:HTTM domain-containing protein [Alphaproteobacteria bacterium]